MLPVKTPLDTGDGQEEGHDGKAETCFQARQQVRLCSQRLQGPPLRTIWDRLTSTPSYRIQEANQAGVRECIDTSPGKGGPPIYQPQVANTVPLRPTHGTGRETRFSIYAPGTTTQTGYSEVDGYRLVHICPSGTSTLLSVNTKGLTTNVMAC